MERRVVGYLKIVWTCVDTLQNVDVTVSLIKAQ